MTKLELRTDKISNKSTNGNLHGQHKLFYIYYYKVIRVSHDSPHSSFHYIVERNSEKIIHFNNCTYF